MSPMKRWWLLALTSVLAEESDVVEVLALDLQEARAERVASELIYDHIIIKFDSACSEHKDFDLGEYIEEQLKQTQRESLKTVDTKAAGFASLTQKSGNNNSFPDPATFKTVFNKHLSDAQAIVGVPSLQPILLDKTATNDNATTAAAPARRRLGETSSAQREEEILSALHLLAALQLIGSDHVSEFLALEKRGNWKDALALVKEHAQVEVKDSWLTRMEKRLETKQNSRNATLTRKAADGDKNLQNEAEWMSHQALSIVTETESLNRIGLKLIHNPLLGADLLNLAHLLPCAAFKPEADRSKEPLGQIAPPSRNPPLKAIRVIRESNVTVSPSPRTEKVSSFQTTVDNVEKKFLGLFKEAQSTESPIQYTLVVPNDRYFANQWYLRGPSQSQPYGAQIVDGWSSMLRDQFLNSSAANSSLSQVALEFANLANVPYGMTVAILDSGCSRNSDLVNQFWRNTETPGCTSDSFVGDDTGTVSPSGVSRDCVGYDFGNNEPDPTNEVVGKIHGSSTSGLVAAESNNKLDISGVCPHCKIMCLKIYDSDQQKITMSSVLRALEYVAEKGVKISNHSYGGFGASEAEYAAHAALEKLGHLSICSSGNNGCDLDSESGPNACLSDTGEWLGPFTPASYDLPSIVSVGGTTQDGELDWFSNYGAKSVDVFAPGSGIITIYGKNELASVKGTSFSAPIVAGMAAVLWSYHPELTAEKVKELIMETGTEVHNLTGKAKSSRIASLARMMGSDSVVALSEGASSLHFIRLLLPILIVMMLS